MRACLHVWMHTLGVLGGQKRVLDALELGLETVVSYHVSAKTLWALEANASVQHVAETNHQQACHDG